MIFILICTAVYAVAATCDLNKLSLPENADSWSCNKPVENGKVEKYARCKIVCHDGYDFWKGNVHTVLSPQYNSYYMHHILYKL